MTLGEHLLLLPQTRVVIWRKIIFPSLHFSIYPFADRHGHDDGCGVGSDKVDGILRPHKFD